MKRNLIVLMFLLTSLSLIGCKNGQEIITEGRSDDAVKLNIDLKGSLQNPAFSPDGKSIVFTRFRNGYNVPPSDIYIFNLDTEQLKELVSDENSNVNLPGECWNAAIKSIVFSSDREPHDEIYSINEYGKTGDEMKITDRTAKVSYEPSFSPDGNWIVFESHNLDDEGNGVITKYKIDGSSGYVDLTPAGSDSRQPNWSPAGDKILFQKVVKDQWDLWSIDTDGTNSILLTNFEGNKTDAVFSTDGKFVIFSYENSELKHAHIYKVPISGGKPVRLTNFEGYEGAPSISPDGSKIVFESSAEDPETSGKTSLWLLRITVN